MSMIDPIPEAWEVKRVCAGSRLLTFSSVKHCSGTSASAIEGQCSMLGRSHVSRVCRERSVGSRPLEGISATRAVVPKFGRYQSTNFLHSTLHKGLPVPIYTSDPAQGNLRVSKASNVLYLESGTETLDYIADQPGQE